MKASPFKFLDAFSREDRDIFFGRDSEIEDLYSQVFFANTLLVYGLSGTGKTSLIQCGLANRFDDADWFPIFVRYNENILESLDKQLEKKATRPFIKESTTSEKLYSFYLGHFKPIHLIFDQFEELFIFGDEEEQKRFGKELATALEEGLFELRIIFIIREEYLANLTILEKFFPDLFYNRVRIERMNKASAIKAIEGPCEARSVYIEDGLSNRILDQLGAEKSSSVELTYLQVFLDKLYRKALESSPDSPTLSNADMEKVGSLGNVLADFLTEQLSSMPDPNLAETVLKTMITPAGTKKVMGIDEILNSLREIEYMIKPDDLGKILNTFVSVRILKEKDEPGRYELIHDSIAEKIFDRMTGFEKDLLEISQLLENRFAEYEKRGNLLDSQTLAMIAPYERKLKNKPKLTEFIETSRKSISKRKANEKRVRISLMVFPWCLFVGIFLVIALSIDASFGKSITSIFVLTIPLAYSFVILGIINIFKHRRTKMQMEEIKNKNSLMLFRLNSMKKEIVESERKQIILSKKIFDKFPGDYDAEKILALAYEKSGKLQEALDIWGRLENRTKKSGEAMLRKSILLFKLGRIDDSIATIQKLCIAKKNNDISISPEDEKEIYLLKSRIEAKKRNFEKAENEITKSLVVSKDPENLSYSAFYLLLLKQYQEALEKALEASKTAVTEKEYFLSKKMLFHAYLFNGKMKKAEQILEDNINEKNGNHTFLQSIIDDFDEFEQSGVMNLHFWIFWKKLKKDATIKIT